MKILKNIFGNKERFFMLNFECRNNPKLLNDKNFAKVSFEELTKDPVKSMEEIY